MRAKLLGASCRGHAFGMMLAALIMPVAFAADVGKTGKIVAPVTAEAEEPTRNRSSFYVGLLGGYDVTVLHTEGVDLANGKLMAGVMAGWNWRVAQSLVLGLEVDWMFTGVSASSGADEVLLKATTDHLVSVRGRVGVPFGPALLYLTAGPAWQQVKLTINEVSGREWQLGAALGAGAEVELTRSLFLRLEAMHYIFPANGAPLASFFESENQHTTARIGLGFKLN